MRTTRILLSLAMVMLLLAVAAPGQALPPRTLRGRFPLI